MINGIVDSLLGKVQVDGGGSLLFRNELSVRTGRKEKAWKQHSLACRTPQLAVDLCRNSEILRRCIQALKSGYFARNSVGQQTMKRLVELLLDLLGVGGQVELTPGGHSS